LSFKDCGIFLLTYSIENNHIWYYCTVKCEQRITHNASGVIFTFCWIFKHGSSNFSRIHGVLHAIIYRVCVTVYVKSWVNFKIWTYTNLTKNPYEVSRSRIIRRTSVWRWYLYLTLWRILRKCIVPTGVDWNLRCRTHFAQRRCTYTYLVCIQLTLVVSGGTADDVSFHKLLSAERFKNLKMI